MRAFPRRDYLAEMIERKGLLSLAEASVVLTPLSMIMPACGEGTVRDTVSSTPQLQAPPHAQPHCILLYAPVKPAVQSGCINRGKGSAVREVSSLYCSALLRVNLESGVLLEVCMRKLRSGGLCVLSGATQLSLCPELPLLWAVISPGRMSRATGTLSWEMCLQ